MIKMQNQNKRYCPLCRADVVQKANECTYLNTSPSLCHPDTDMSAAHIDEKLVRYLEQWFPKETKEKQAYNEIERRRELLGEIYVGESPPPPCVVM